MLNHNVTKVPQSRKNAYKTFVPMLNHNVTKGQNSLYMIFIDSGRVQYNIILPHLSAAKSTVKYLYNFG